MGCFGSKDDRPVEEVDIPDTDLPDRKPPGVRASFKMADLVDYKTGAGSMFMGLLAVLIILVVCIAVFKSPRGTDSDLGSDPISMTLYSDSGILVKGFPG
eukprot:860092_1